MNATHVAIVLGLAVLLLVAALLLVSCQVPLR
jgi:hypothetical protein